MWGDFDYSELQAFGERLEAMQQAYPSFVEECTRELAARLLAKAVQRTPVMSGDLRRGWTIGPIQKSNSGYEIEIINPVEYSKYVEFGHRTPNGEGWVEGRFMLTVSESEMKAELPAIMERKMLQYMERYLGGGS